MDALAPVSVGIDVGQLYDNSAVCVCEVERRSLENGRKEVHYIVRHIERLALGTSYPDVAKRVADILANELLRQRKRCVLIDVTGVGRPVFEMLRLEARDRPETRDVMIKPITFAHGEHYNAETGRLGKAYLVSRLQALLQSSRVHAPNTAEVRAMLEELKVYEIKLDTNGKDEYGAFKVGTHDDLATSLGLACLEEHVTASELLRELSERQAIKDKGMTFHQERTQKKFDWYW